VTDVWSERAAAYREAVEQREGDDLDLLMEWAETREGLTVLDVATGGGHVARRLRDRACSVTTLDPAPGMGADVLARAEDIPFADGSFEVVVTRIAPHHFGDVGAAVREMARVAKNLVLVEDTLHESDAVEEAERLRDPTHVRSYTEDEWRALFDEAGLDVEAVAVLEKRRPLDAWLERTGTSDADAASVRDLLAPHVDGDDYVDRKILLKGRKR
jgi:SAM-dependent methyltransferase